MRAPPASVTGETGRTAMGVRHLRAQPWEFASCSSKKGRARTSAWVLSETTTRSLRAQSKRMYVASPTFCDQIPASATGGAHIGIQVNSQVCRLLRSMLICKKLKRAWSTEAEATPACLPHVAPRAPPLFTLNIGIRIIENSICSTFCDLCERHEIIEGGARQGIEDQCM